MLFYWWPVWAVGFLLAGLTWLGGNYLAIVPAGTEAVENVEGGREALVLPASPTWPRILTPEAAVPSLRVSKGQGSASCLLSCCSSSSS